MADAYSATARSAACKAGAQGAALFDISFSKDGFTPPADANVPIDRHQENNFSHLATHCTNSAGNWLSLPGCVQTAP